MTSAPSNTLKAPRLICLCANAMGAGKSTVAEHLTVNHLFHPTPFAKPLKAMAFSLILSTGIDLAETQERVYGTRKEEIVPALGITSRRLQQLLGTEFGRNMIDPDLWVNITMAAAREALSQGRSVVIDDLRFVNEYSAIMAAGGECYRVCRPGASVTAAHESEGQLDGIAMPEIWNTGTIEDLHRATDVALRLPLAPN